MDIKNRLLKEAQNRVVFHSEKPPQEPSKLNSLFLKEARVKLEKLADFDKEGMAAQAGVRDVRNSTANTQFGAPILSESPNVVESKLYEAYKQFFYEDISGLEHKVEGGIFIPTTGNSEYKKIPRSHFRIEFPFYRSIMPSHPDFQNNVDDINDDLEKIAPELLQLKELIEESNIPVLPYYHATVRTKNKGGVSPEEALNFINADKSRQQNLKLPNGEINPLNNKFYADILNRVRNGEKMQMTKQHPHDRKYEREFAKDLNVPTYILKAISYKILEGFKPDWMAFEKDLGSQITKLVNASKTSGLPDNEIEEKKKAYIAYFRNIYQKTKQAVMASIQPIDPNDNNNWHRVGNMRGFKVNGEGKHTMPVDVPVAYLKLVLYHMTLKNPASRSELGPNDFTIPDHKLTFLSNGMDSIPTNPDKNMPVVPSLRRYPNNMVGYDTDQSNLGRTHLVHNGREVENILSQYGPICENLFKKFATSPLSNASPALSRAWSAVFNNRTNAESILDIASFFNDYKDFRRRFLNKSLASMYTGGRGLNDMKSLQQSVITEQGFALLKRYGYYVSKMMDFISAMAHSASEEIVTSREDNGNVVQEKFYGRTLSTSTGKAGQSRIIIGMRYANSAPLLGNNDPELRKIVEQYRNQEQASDDSGEYLRQTQHPQKANELGQEFQTSSTYKVVHDLRYFVGLATSKANFQKAIGADDYATWDEAVNVLITRYPQIENEVGAIIEPMNANLKELSLRFKRALTRVQQDLSKQQSFEIIVDDKVTNSIDILDPQVIEAASEVGLQENEVQQTINPNMSHMYPSTENVDSVDSNQLVETLNSPDDNILPQDSPLVPENKPMPSSFVSKRDTSKRILLKQRPSSSTGKLPKASIIDSLIKLSNKMDACGEYTLSNKLDFIIDKIRD